MKKWSERTKTGKTAVIAALAIVVAALAAAALLMFTGDINVTLTENTLRVEATYYGGIEVPYSEFDSVTFREDLDIGRREDGFDSPRLSMGVYENSEFGYYNLYAYTKAECYVVLTSGQKTLVLGYADAAQTRLLYEALLAKIG